MSSKGRGPAGGGAKSFFGTPPSPVVRLLERQPLPGGLWLESGAGNGGIIKAVNSVRSDVRWSAIEVRGSCLCDLHPLCAELVCADFMELGPQLIAKGRRWPVSVINPAFPIATMSVLLSLELCDWVAVLERSHWLSDHETRAATFHEMMPLYEYVIGRCDFDGRGGDSTTYSWFVFGPGDRKRTETIKRVLRRPTPAEAEIDKAVARANGLLLAKSEGRAA